jgi:conjugative transposon TraJ protein
MLEYVSNQMSFYMEKQGYAFRNSVKQWMSEVLEVLYAAASLCINVVRTFILIILVILGPMVFGFAVFDGFQQSLTVWVARYVNIFMWLPIANILGSILGKIQENMLKIDISQLAEEGETFFSSSDVAYLIFLVIGIVAYFCVPTVANYIAHAGGGNSILQKVNMIVSSSSRSAMGAGSAGAGMAADALGNQARQLYQGYAGSSQGDYFADGANSAQRDKLSGKT